MFWTIQEIVSNKMDPLCICVIYNLFSDVIHLHFKDNVSTHQTVFGYLSSNISRRGIIFTSLHSLVRFPYLVKAAECLHRFNLIEIAYCTSRYLNLPDNFTVPFQSSTLVPCNILTGYTKRQSHATVRITEFSIS